MTAKEQIEFRRRLGYILHRGLVEIRSLSDDPTALDQIHDLADVLEFLPRFLIDPTDDDRATIHTVIREFQERHPEGLGAFALPG